MGGGDKNPRLTIEKDEVEMRKEVEADESAKKATGEAMTRLKNRVLSKVVTNHVSSTCRKRKSVVIMDHSDIASKKVKD